MLDGSIDELLYFRERNDLVESSCGLFATHTENGAIQEDVLPPGKFWMETSPHFEQAADSAVKFDMTCRRAGYTRQNFEQRGLACPVAADKTENLTGFDVEVDIIKRQEGRNACATNIAIARPQQI